FSTDLGTLTVTERPRPKLGPSAVLIEVKAAGVNPVDWKVMAGGLDGLIDTVFPVIPGWDVAGVVAGVGPDVPEFVVGDEVIAYARKDTVGGGTFAELVAVPAVSVAAKPATLTFPQAAGLPLAGGTALRTLDAIRVRGGDTVLVHAAAGGVGAFAVQIATARGARVIGTASETNHEYLRGLGSDPVSYGAGLAERVRAIAPDGVDAVADFVGGQLDTTLAVLAADGRHASVADPSVQEHGGRWIWVRPDGAETARLAALAEDGKLSVDIAQTFGLDGVAEAFELSQSGHVRGKLIIVP
ncbi:MAG: NADP-dependent oxidoreductase, partial [Microlunatus sp.]|nr:NADP-dependent oxidoreductase [Microlunatus sp.]